MTYVLRRSSSLLETLLSFSTDLQKIFDVLQLGIIVFDLRDTTLFACSWIMKTTIYFQLIAQFIYYIIQKTLL